MNAFKHFNISSWKKSTKEGEVSTVMVIVSLVASVKEQNMLPFKFVVKRFVSNISYCLWNRVD